MADRKPEKVDTSRADFIKERFGRYYSRVDTQTPSRFENREFGVITERGGMWRHLGFGRPKELQDFLKKQVPLHAYHSSAYYTKPNARTMDEKGWLGADLIFDLDADHIQGTGEMTMEEMFAAVKIQFQKLVHEFLLGDFGFDEKDVKIVFSGGRGYHAHVSDEKVLKLNRHERREIVDYITLPNLDVDGFIIKEPLFSKKYFEHVKVEETYRLYPKDTPGWKGRTTRGILEFINRTEKLPREEVVAELREKGITKLMAENIYDDTYMGNPGNRGIDKIRDDYNLDIFSNNSIRKRFIEGILKEIAMGSSGETDEPVTSDIKRLIRLPGSLHGKTSLVVRTLDVNELKEFLPLRDAVWDGFNETPVKVQGLADKQIKLKNKNFEVKEDSENELPEYAALFFVCQKVGRILK